jgi:FkbH-like protein
MVSEVKSFDAFTIPRVAQLTQRSNQFNLRTVRYSEEDIRKIGESDRYLTFSFTLEDIYGDNGLISAIIIEKRAEVWFIDTWIMSCRVLKRGMENFVLQIIMEAAKTSGAKQLVGEYLPTAKNQLVQDHYSSLGFSPQDAFWILNTDDFVVRKNFIERK